MAQRDAWIRRYHPSSTAMVTVACFPHAGGSASSYFPLSERLAPSVEALVVQYPGRQDRRTEAPVTSIDELAERTVAALAGYGDRPLALFGHSMGALVAFEVAKRLTDRPVGLFASGRRAPSVRRRETLHSGSGDAEVVRQIKALSGTDDSVLGNPELLPMILPAIRADFTALENYRYAHTEPLTCPIIALVGDTDPVTTVHDARGWAEHTAAGFELHLFSGGHFYLSEHTDELADLITHRLTALV